MEKLLDKIIFKEKMMFLEVLYDQKLTEPRIMAYYECIYKKFSTDDFIKAVEGIIKTENRFPAVSAFYKHKPQFMGGAF